MMHFLTWEQVREEDHRNGSRSLSNLRRHEKKLRKSIRAASKSGRRNNLYRCVRRYLESYAAKLLATIEANKQLKAHLRIKDEAKLRAIAQKLNVWRGSDEIVKCFFKGAPDKFRPIQSFGIEHKALQQLVSNALRDVLVLNPRQFAINGGTHAAIEQVAKLIGAGNVYATEVDIHNFYPSVKGEAVVELLPLPRPVTRSVVLQTTYQLSWPGLPSHQLLDPAGNPISAEQVAVGLYKANGLPADVRAGISQGSAVSPLVAEGLLAPVHAGLEGSAISFADNFFVAGKSAAEVNDRMNALCAHLEVQPTGPFWSRQSGVRHLANGIDFLGHRIRLINEKVSICPTEKNFNKFWNAFYKKMNAVKAKGLSEAQRKRRLADANAYVRSWTSAFALWPESGKFKDERKAQLKKFAAENKVWWDVKKLG